MRLRKSEITDIVEIRNLVLSLAHFFIEDKNTSLSSLSTLPMWLDESLKTTSFERRMLDREYVHFVYVIDSEIVGYISIFGGNHIYHLFVSKAFQGRGIARKLWNHARSELPSTTYTVRSSMVAIPVYESFGFNITEPPSCKDGVRFQVMQKA